MAVMVDSDLRARVLRVLRHHSNATVDGLGLGGVKTVLCAHAGEDPKRVEEALEELVEQGDVEYDGEIFRPVE